MLIAVNTPLMVGIAVVAEPLVISHYWEITSLLVGEFFASLVTIRQQAYWVGCCMGYTLRQEVRDLLPACLSRLAMSGMIMVSGYTSLPNPIATLVFQILVGTVAFSVLCWALSLKAVQALRNLRTVSRPSPHDWYPERQTGAAHVMANPLYGRLQNPLPPRALH